MYPGQASQRTSDPVLIFSFSSNKTPKWNIRSNYCHNKQQVKGMPRHLMVTCHLVHVKLNKLPYHRLKNQEHYREAAKLVLMLNRTAGLLVEIDQCLCANHYNQELLAKVNFSNQKANRTLRMAISKIDSNQDLHWAPKTYQRKKRAYKMPQRLNTP